MPKNGSGPSGPKPTQQQTAVLRHYVACGLNAARTEREFKHSERNVRRLAELFAAEVDHLELEYEAERRQDEREAQDRARVFQRQIDAKVAELMPRVLEIVEQLLNSDDPTDRLRGIRLVCDLRSKVVPLPPEPDAATRQAIRRLEEEPDVAP